MKFFFLVTLYDLIVFAPPPSPHLCLWPPSVCHSKVHVWGLLHEFCGPHGFCYHTWGAFVIVNAKLVPLCCKLHNMSNIFTALKDVYFGLHDTISISQVQILVHVAWKTLTGVGEVYLIQSLETPSPPSNYYRYYYYCCCFYFLLVVIPNCKTGESMHTLTTMWSQRSVLAHPIPGNLWLGSSKSQL